MCAAGSRCPRVSFRFVIADLLDVERNIWTPSYPVSPGDPQGQVGLEMFPTAD